MKLDGYDFIIVGAILGVGSGLLMAKPYMAPSFPEETSATFLGHNPFVLRSTIITKHEYMAGAVWLVLGLLLTLIGTVRSVRASQQGHLIGAWYDIVVLTAAALVLWRGTLLLTERTSRAEYLPLMVDAQSELFRRAVEALGATPTATVTAEQVEQRRKEATRRLDQIGKLLDEPRKGAEVDNDYARRLASYFPGAPVP